MPAGAPEDDLICTDFPPGERRASGGDGQVEPRNVFDGTAGVADEMMMAVQVGIVAGSLALGENFADESGHLERAQIVVDRGARGTRIVAVESDENFLSGGMDGVFGQEFEHRIALRRGPQFRRFECPFQFRA